MSRQFFNIPNDGDYNLCGQPVPALRHHNVLVVPGLIPPQAQDFALLVELRKIPVGPFL